jgi:hypothetical protein
MKLLRFVAVAMLAGVLAAAAAPVGPVRTYDAEKARLIAAGYQPFKFLRWDRGLCTGDFCQRYPEIWHCSASQCAFVFERHSDHDFLVVVTAKDRQRVLRVRPAHALIEPVNFIKESSPLYKDKKAELIAQGYRPLKLLPSDMSSTYTISRAYPEALNCAVDANYCVMVFVQVSTGRYMRITTDGVDDEDMAAISALRPVEASDIEDIKKRLPRRR